MNESPRILGSAVRRMSFAIAVLILASVGVAVAASASGAAIPVAPGEDAKVQPGGTVRIGDARCTLNFMYMGTAGDCVLGHSRTSNADDTPRKRPGLRAPAGWRKTARTTGSGSSPMPSSPRLMTSRSSGSTGG